MSANAVQPAPQAKKQTNKQAKQAATQAKTPGTNRERQRRLLVALFLAPTVLGLGIFVMLPIVASLVLAFFRWDVITPPQFAGLDNFTDAAKDSTVLVSFANTIGFVIVAVTLQLVIALALAMLVQSVAPTWLRGAFRSALFFPLILSAASVSLVMGYLFNDDFGLVNAAISAVGASPVGWLTTVAGSRVLVIIIYVWQNFGFTFLLFLGGLAAIPTDVKEAASIDGATGLRRLTGIILPLLSPTTLVASVTAMIAALQIFDQPYVLTRGGPGDANRTAVMVIYESAFRELEIGKASAIGLMLMVLIMAVTLAQFRLSRRFTFYQ